MFECAERCGCWYWSENAVISVRGEKRVSEFVAQDVNFEMVEDKWGRSAEGVSVRSLWDDYEIEG
jgi:hypothetical protein